MIYVKKVVSTLKKGVDVELGPLTVIVGPNGGGKSSIVQSIELATCGHVSDVEGREQVKHAHAIGRLFPQEEPIFVKAELSDGSLFEWKMERNNDTEGFKRPEHDAPRKVSWPVQDLKAVLTGDASSVQAWLENQVLGSITEQDLLHSLPPSTHEVVKTLAKRIRKHDFMALAKEAKSAARLLRTDATKTENTVEQMMQNIPIPLMADERAALEKRLSDFEIQAEGVSAGQVAAWNDDLLVVTQQYNTILSELSQLKMPTDNDFKAAKTVGTAMDLVKTHAEELGLDVCWTCGNTEPQFPNHVERLVSLKEKLKPFAQTLNTKAELTGRLNDVQGKIEKLSAQIANAVVAPDIRAERDQVYRQLAADDSARKAWQNANAQRTEIDNQRLRADQMTLAAKSLEKAGKDLLERKKFEFEESVNRFLPNGDKFTVDLDSARIGLQRNGSVHSALSGAEWSRVLLALAAARSNGSTPCVLAPEDRAWDRDTLERVMTALANSQVQIVLMSTVHPAKPVPGWNIVTVGG